MASFPTWAQDAPAPANSGCKEVPANQWKAPEQGVPPSCKYRLLEVKQEGGQTVNLPYAITRDGDAVFQGDIVIGKGFELVQVSEPATLQSIGNLALYSLFDRMQSHKWPKGIVYFSLPDNLPRKLRDKALAAMTYWMSKTKIIFKPKTPTTRDYVLFANPTDPDTCNSMVGRVGGAQTIKLGANCGAGNAIHEIGHALGLTHEQMRSDRDKFVTFHPENLSDDKYAPNFEIHPELYKDLHAYCYGSIMHYPRDAFGTDTLIPVDPNAKIGQRDGLDACDIEAINTEYNDEVAARQ
jgi:hypothetical protein